MDLKAPTPSGKTAPVSTPSVQDVPMSEEKPAVKLTVSLIGCGGMGTNISRALAKSTLLDNVLFMDTSTANIIGDEVVWCFGDGSGSGGNRKENARVIEAEVPTLPSNYLVDSDVVILVFSTAGGSGSLIGPVMAREFSRRGQKVICAIVADTSSSNWADNTLATLKTLTAIATKNDIFLPAIIVQNDLASNRGEVDKTLISAISKTIHLLADPVLEVDRNDRLNFVDPSAVVRTSSGLKLLTIGLDDTSINSSVMLGYDSKDMVDSLLVLTKSPDDVLDNLPLARQKKIGYFSGKDTTRVVGQITSDISAIDNVIDHVERMQTLDRSSKPTSKLDRLASKGDDDLIY